MRGQAFPDSWYTIGMDGVQQQVPHDVSDAVVSSGMMNRLRAAVLGANDGIISNASIVVGVAGATADTRVILISGVAGLLAGAFSMAAGEYVSVSSQRDTEKALLEKERGELKDYPREEFEELKRLYREKGLSEQTAETVARELSAHDEFLAHAEAELGIDPADLTNPLQASLASFLSFSIGGAIPLAAILLPPASMRVAVTFASVLVALFITGLASAKASRAPYVRAVVRIVLGGALAMLVTYYVGTLIGVSA